MKTATELSKKLKDAPITQEAWTGSIPEGSHIRQGDVYLCNEKKPTIEMGDILSNGESIQIAPGTTQGSRHVITGAKVFAPKQTSPLVGVVICVEDGKTAKLVHPTHRPFNIVGPCTLQVRFPRDFMREELRRLQD